MGAAVPACELEKGCVTMAHEECCHVDKCEDEFALAVNHGVCNDAYIPCNKRASSSTSGTVRVKSISSLAEESEYNDPLKQMPEYVGVGFSSLLADSWVEWPVNGKSTQSDRREEGGDQRIDLDGSLKAQELARVSPEGVPLDDGIELLSPELIQDLLKNRQCILVDVRGADRASGLIEGALYVPAIDMRAPFAARVPELVQHWTNERLIVFFCQFCKHRAPHCANLYRAQCNSMQRVALMEGGFRAWQSKGLPVQAGGGTAAERAAADSWALHQGALIRSQLHSLA